MLKIFLPSYSTFMNNYNRNDRPFFCFVLDTAALHTYVYIHTLTHVIRVSFFLRKYTYSLSNCSMADGAFGLVPLADAVGTLHAEQVVAAGHQGRDHFTFEAH